MRQPVDQDARAGMVHGRLAGSLQPDMIRTSLPINRDGPGVALAGRFGAARATRPDYRRAA